MSKWDTKPPHRHAKPQIAKVVWIWPKMPKCFYFENKFTQRPVEITVSDCPDSKITIKSILSTSRLLTVNCPTDETCRLNTMCQYWSILESRLCISSLSCSNNNCTVTQNMSDTTQDDSQAGGWTHSWGLKTFKDRADNLWPVCKDCFPEKVKEAVICKTQIRLN